MTTAFVRKLVVEVVEARDLLPKDGQGSSNPYVVVDFDGQRKRTQTKIRELNPKWEEMLEFVVVDPNTMEAEELDVEVYNDKRFGSGNGRKNHFLGRIRIYASQFPKKGDEGLIFFPLEKKSFFSWVRGEIGLKIYYVDELVEEPPPPPPTDPPPPPPAEEEPPKPDHPPPLGPDDKFPMPTDAAIEAQEQNPPPIIVGEEMRSGPPNEASPVGFFKYFKYS